MLRSSKLIFQFASKCKSLNRLHHPLSTMAAAKPAPYDFKIETNADAKFPAE
ncbi:hypothetical protein PF010_g24380 [Phytophthora fragariae]|uniref:Uncharacterized protein n=1 Tax=Phytophthora fragariae TaxID=53985 RepID=A0A6G0K388_9STRA|nr:hypothetical protein PF010_g24380 [Phytophthora fragariae]